MLQEPSGPACAEPIVLSPSCDARARDLPALRGALPIPRRCERVAQLAAADGRRPAREGRRRQLLHVHLHQLAPVAPVRPRVGRGLPGSRARHDRRAHARVLVRARPGEHPPGARARRASTYPIAVDNDYAVWEAFANHYWPALYFIDAEGRIRHHAFGEGDYERSESVIQMLLTEAGLDDDGQEYVSVDARGPEAPADWNSLLSPETYLGYRQTMDFASPGGLTPDEPRVYEAPADVAAQPLEPVGGLDGRRGDRRAERSGWTHRVRRPCPRRPPGDGPGGRVMLPCRSA